MGQAIPWFRPLDRSENTSCKTSRWRLAIVAVGIGALMLPALGPNGAAGPAPAGGEWKLAWSDEFDGKDD